jgi:hypothetical protein
MRLVWKIWFALQLLYVALFAIQVLVQKLSPAQVQSQAGSGLCGFLCCTFIISLFVGGFSE